jgi:hypothetical protein
MSSGHYCKWNVTPTFGSEFFRKKYIHVWNISTLISAHKEEAMS